LTEGYRGVWVFVEQKKGEFLPVGLQLLGKGREIADRLGEKLSALVLGRDVKDKAKALIGYGADEVLVVDQPKLEDYQTDLYAHVVTELVQKERPSVFLLGATYNGRDLAPTVAGRLETGLSSDCTRLEIDEEGRLVQVVPAFRGMASILCPDRRPQMATIRPGVFRLPAPDESRTGTVREVQVDLETVENRAELVELYLQEPEGKPLEEAETVVAGGAGIGDLEGWKLIEDLAQVLGAAVGATRPPLDEGWAREDQMIGQSGKTVRPDLYIGIGISGETQHVVGIEDAKVVVAINNDPGAPIFKVADYGIVADYRKVVPVLIERFKKLKNTG